MNAWELEAMLRDEGWAIVDGWGEWGDDLYDTANAAALAPEQLGRALQQATATTWMTVAE